MSRVAIGAVEPYGGQHHLTQSDISHIESLRSAKRQAEVASWRSLLRSTFSITSDILYHPSGAPYIFGYEGFISVSHSSEYVAVMISEVPCAVDIESISRNFERVSSRYVSTFESELIADGAKEKPLLLPILWSAKEVLYKLSPLDGLDLLDDLHILSIENCLIHGSVKGVDGVVEMSYSVQNEHVIVCTI